MRTVSADETNVEVVHVMSVSGTTRALVLFCDAVGVKPSPFVTEDLVGKASVHAWSATTKQTVNSLMSEVGTKNGYFSDGRRLVRSV